MCRLLLLLLLVGFIALVLAVAAVINYGFMGLVGVLVVLAVLALILKVSAGKIFERVFMMPFQAKGAVLKGAELRVNSVTPASPPKREPKTYDSDDDDLEDESLEVEEDDESDVQAQDSQELQTIDLQEKNRNWYYLDVTITPQAATGGGFSMWEAGELELAHPDAKATDVGSDDKHDVGTINSIEVWEEGAWREDEGEKYPGAQRVRLLAGVNPGVRRVRLRYYFELFGDVALPEWSEAAANQQS